MIRDPLNTPIFFCGTTPKLNSLDRNVVNSFETRYPSDVTMIALLGIAQVMMLFTKIHLNLMAVNDGGRWNIVDNTYNRDNLLHCIHIY